MKAKVKFMSQEGTLVNKYANSTDYGFVVLRTEDVKFVDNRVNKSVRTCLLRGDVSVLEEIVKTNPEGLEGKIRIVEMTEPEFLNELNGNSDLSNSLRREINMKLLQDDYENAISSYLKKNPQTDEVLMKDGQRILRFNFYDPTGEQPDILVAHDRVSNITPF